MTGRSAQPDGPGFRIEHDRAEDLQKGGAELGRRRAHRPDAAASVRRLEDQVESRRSQNWPGLFVFDRQRAIADRIDGPALMTFAGPDAEVGQPPELRAALDQAFVECLVDVDRVWINRVGIAGVDLRKRTNSAEADVYDGNIGKAAPDRRGVGREEPVLGDGNEPPRAQRSRRTGLARSETPPFR